MATRAIIQTTALRIVLGAILFVTAGDLRWLRAWIFLAEILVSSLSVSAWLARHDPALLESRLSTPFHRDQKRWDQIFLAAFAGWMALIALDARRLAWSRVPLPAQALGPVLIALCTVLVWQVFRFNSFAAPQVRIQPERHQHVITGGPCRFLRHPTYAAALLYFLGTPLLLGSFWGLLPVPFFAAGLAARAAGEERMLRQAVPSYDDYTTQTRFRLIPFVW